METLTCINLPNSHYLSTYYASQKDGNRSRPNWNFSWAYKTSVSFQTEFMAILNIKGMVVEFHTIGYFYDLGF